MVVINILKGWFFVWDDVVRLHTIRFLLRRIKRLNITSQITVIIRKIVDAAVYSRG